MILLDRGAIVLIPGHGDKGDRDDPGAVADLDRDGKVERWESEAMVARAMPYMTAPALGYAGWNTHMLDHGPYSGRNDAAGRIIAGHPVGLSAILYWHLDALPEGAAASLIGHLGESTRGAALARAIARESDARLPSAARGDRPTRVEGFAPGSTGWQARCRNVLSPSWSNTGRLGCGVLLESFAITSLPGLGWPVARQWLLATAEAVVAGVEAWRASTEAS